jgi:membrane-bound ClpP family serine protease
MDYLTLAYVLIGIGIVLMVTELFIPTGGICFVLASISALTGIALAFFHGDTSTGMITLIGVFVAVPVILSAMFYLWPNSLWGRRLVPNPEDSATVAQMPANALLERLRGRIGKTISPLRPAGIVEFDGKRIDCVTEGMMIDAGLWVRCVDVKAGHVVVRQIEKPNLQDLENTSFD